MESNSIAIVKLRKGGNIPGIGLSVGPETVRHIAKLARVKVEEEEVAKFSEQFSRILEFFNELDKIDVSNVEPMYHVIPLENVLREDKPSQPLDVEDALKNAPERKDKYFKAPPII